MILGPILEFSYFRRIFAFWIDGHGIVRLFSVSLDAPPATTTPHISYRRSLKGGISHRKKTTIRRDSRGGKAGSDHDDRRQ